MIRNKDAWKKWEDKYTADTPVDFRSNLRLAEAMYDQARAFGVFPLADPLDGLDVCIKLAKVINVPIPSRKRRAGP
ncbi:MAG TPA: hypothetical protein HPP77_05670 [Candidatus Hydrogenedentes bacterium]|nr:hypothetical protein [Candidatus Hydrogenedentota bacterium]HIJ73473.1 hypothetical protein [Candidatus Hydrogenedentota bacterium]